MTTVPFGDDWLLSDGCRAQLCWHRFSGHLVLHRTDGHSIQIATINDEDDLRARLDGWEFHCQSTSGFMWLAGQLDGAR